MPTQQELDEAIELARAEKAANKQELIEYLRTFRDEERSVDQEFLTKLINLVVNDL